VIALAAYTRVLRRNDRASVDGARSNKNQEGTPMLRDLGYVLISIAWWTLVLSTVAVHEGAHLVIPGL
jgi:hypothetical protein